MMRALGNAYLQKDKDAIRFAEKLQNNDQLEKYLLSLDPDGYDPAELENMKKRFLKKIKEEMSSGKPSDESGFDNLSRFSRSGATSKPSRS